MMNQSLEIGCCIEYSVRLNLRNTNRSEAFHRKDTSFRLLVALASGPCGSCRFQVGKFPRKKMKRDREIWGEGRGEGRKEKEEKQIDTCINDVNDATVANDVHFSLMGRPSSPTTPTTPSKRLPRHLGRISMLESPPPPPPPPPPPLMAQLKRNQTVRVVATPPTSTRSN